MLKITRCTRSLCNKTTAAERLLWRQLCKRQLDGIKFRRHYPIGPYITDFAAVEKRLIIELDGGQQADLHNYDRVRECYLLSRGFRVLRYWNNQIFTEMDAVLAEIRGYLHSPP